MTCQSSHAGGNQIKIEMTPHRSFFNLVTYIPFDKLLATNNTKLHVSYLLNQMILLLLHINCTCITLAMDIVIAPILSTEVVSVNISELYA